MDPAEFHNFAVATVRNRRPVDCRVAIGRSYYAVLNVAAEPLRQANCKIGDGPQGHGEVFNFLLSVSSTRAVFDAGSWMKDARQIRNKADYKLSDTSVEKFATADLFVSEAGQHIQSLRAAFGEPTRQHVLADLELYKQQMQPGYRAPSK